MIASTLLATIGPSPVDRAWAEAWAPRLRPVRSEWCEANLRLPTEFAATPGRFSFRGREYQREIIDAVDDPGTHEIVFVAAPQVGKTELLRAVVQSQGEVDAAPMMFAGPDQSYAREQREIIYAGCEASPSLRGRIPPPAKRNDRWIDLDKCYVFLAWSGSTQRLSGRSCKIVLCSEVDRWQAPVALAEKRTRAFWRSLVFYEGSPVADSPIGWPLYEASDQRTFHVPCPHCDHFQELRFFPHKEGPHVRCGGVAGLKDDKGKWRSPDEARRLACYVCEQGCRIDPAEKAGMVAKGVWCPAGCHVVGGELAGTPDNVGRRRGYQLNALYAPTVSFGDAAEYWLLSRDTEEGMQSFWNDWLGRPYTPRGKTPRWEVLGRRLAGSYPLGFVPAPAYFLTGAADVHPDRVDWVVRAWGNGCTSWLVDFGSLTRINRAAEEAEPEEVLASDLAQLDDMVLAQEWPVVGEDPRGRVGENPRGRSSLRVGMLGIDCGFRPTDVYAYVRARPGRVVAVNGDPKINPGDLFRLSRREINVRTGKRYPAGTVAWGIDTAAYKSDVQGRWHADRTQPGAWWLPSNILEVPGGEDYLRQITNERQKLEVRNGRKVTRWEVITESTGSHFFDCEVYARALADIQTSQEWDASRWPWDSAKAKAKASVKSTQLTTPDGRPFFVTDR